MSDERPFPEDVFNDALERPPSEREAFLDRACRDDSELRSRVKSMLKIAEESPFLLDVPFDNTIPERLGHYVLDREIGRGGMGIVYQARDTHLGRDVALKLLRFSGDSSSGSVDRFAREAKTLAALEHENIARLYAHETTDGLHYLVMELIKGRSLGARLREGPMGFEKTVDLGSQLCRGLSAAHDLKIVHLDLKPDNVMIERNGRIRILDFGIARLFEQPETGERPVRERGRATQPVGTPDYMAPEQERGKGIGAAADIWALGCILYECATGVRPSGPKRDLAKTCRDGLGGVAPRSLAGLICECLAHDPADRPRTIADLESRFSSILRTRRRRSLALKASLAVASAILVVAAGARIWPDGRPELESCVMESETVISGRDAFGNNLWTRDLDETLAVPTPPSLSLPLLPGGRPGPDGVVLATRTRVMCLNADDGSQRWSTSPAWVKPVNAAGTTAFYRFLHIPYAETGSSLYAVGIMDIPWYGSAIQFLDDAGATTSLYHHPGRFSKFHVIDGETTRPKLLVTGSNSSSRFVRTLVPYDTSRHLGYAALIDPLTIEGQAFPYSEDLPEHRDWPGMKRANEVAYLLIPLIHPTLTSDVRFALPGKDSGGRATWILRAVDGRYYTVDERLNPISLYINTESSAESLRLRGELVLPPLMRIADGEMSWIDLSPSD